MLNGSPVNFSEKAVNFNEYNMSKLEQYKEDLSMKLFGRSAILAHAGNQCVECGKPADKFRDILSAKEYKIAATCQHCQDKYWGGLPNE